MKITTTTIIEGCLAVLLMMLAAAALAAEGNPHWNKTGCATCHMLANPVPGNAALRTPTAESGCASCHDGRDAVQCRHVSDVSVDSSSTPATYRERLRDGRIVCTTCHDPLFQCEHPNVAYRFQNPGFLHDRMSRNSGDQCFACHDDSGYAKLNPHADATGDPSRTTCPLCHVETPDESAGSRVSLSFNMHEDMNNACRGCHNVAPHPKGMGFDKQSEGWVHLVRPSGAVLARMDASAAATQVKLPLNPYNGEIYCATCHDPHAHRGTSGNLSLTDHLLRQEKICQACHDK